LKKMLAVHERNIERARALNARPAKGE
jgi:hypothetical protein